MTNSDLLKILNSKDIEVIEEIKLEKETEIKFLNHLEKLQERHSEIKFLNQDLVDIILNLNFKDEDLLRKFRKYNWEDLYEIAKQKDKNPRKTRIYDNFIDFLLRELGIENKKPTKKTDLYTPQKGFDIEADLKQKARRFDVEILFDYTEASKKISVNDFVLYFNRRLQYFTNLLKSRPHMDNTYRISQLKDLYETNTKVSIIGLISSFERTRNGHLVITLEDKSGEIKCFINKKKLDKNDEQHDKNMIQIVENLCLDEGIGIVGKIGKEIVWVDEIVVPSPPNTSELKKTDEEHYVVCMSDLHFGAKVFVDEA
ncbi:MAG: OB-fold nucleic acid binding domain-containing protein, partial [Nanoarchaeota archaeon]